MTRVVSLVPSVTETLLAWGVEPVGVTRFCEAPGIEQVGGTKTPDLAAIVRLRPDVVVMDKEENRAEDAEALVNDGIVVHATHVLSVGDVEPTLQELRRAVELPDQPGLTEAVPAGLAAVPLVVSAWVPIWRRPWMTIGGRTYGSSILAQAGVRNVFGPHDDPYPKTTLDEAAALRPDVVLAPSEPYKFAERHRAELQEVAPVEFVDGQDLFWWGARTAGAVAGLRQLAARLAAR